MRVYVPVTINGPQVTLHGVFYQKQLAIQELAKQPGQQNQILTYQMNSNQVLNNESFEFPMPI